MLTSPSKMPPGIARVLRAFETMSREERMQSLLAYSRKLEPLPERFRDLDRAAFTVPECQTRVDVFPELRDGKLHFYADIDARQSPTIAAVLGIVFSAVNEQPPQATLDIPSDLVPTLMKGMGLNAREAGLTAMIERLKRHARAAIASSTETQ